MNKTIYSNKKKKVLYYPGMSLLKEWMTKSINTPTDDWVNQEIQNDYPPVAPDQLDEDPIELQCIAQGTIFTRTFDTIRKGEQSIPLIQKRQVDVAILLNRQDESVLFQREKDLSIPTQDTQVVSLQKASRDYRAEHFRRISFKNVLKSGSSKAIHNTTIFKQPKIHRSA